jgi:uncharacterized delta-60 repeat protein
MKSYLKLVCGKMLLPAVLAFLYQGTGCFPRPEPVTWEKTFGGTSFDRAYSIDQTADGGYVLAGQTSSFSAGGYDYYIIKLDELGNITWQKNFGGASAEIARSVRQTDDGGYIVTGRSSSFKVGYCDFYIIKLDASGNKSWEKVYGGDSWDDPYSIQQTEDGGYIVAGHTESIGAGKYDVYVMKLDAGGDPIWDETYGGTENDAASSIQQTADGGYIVAGYTASSGAGGMDIWVLKLDSNGTLIWDEAFGGSDHDAANAIWQTTDGGYIVAGYTEASGAGGKDIWVLKLTGSGTVSWDDFFGGTEDDEAKSIQQTADGEYVVAGTAGTAGTTDMYIAKLDETGSRVWERYYGDTNNDAAYAVQQADDGGYIVAGYTHSPDATGELDDDIYILKLNEEGEL